MMTWDEIVALDDDQLNRAVETHVYKRVWQYVEDPSFGRLRWMVQPAGEHPTYATVPHLHTTTSWDSCMELAYRYHIGIWPLMHEQAWLIQQPLSCQAMQACSEEEIRRCICRLAVWYAIHAETPQG